MIFGIFLLVVVFGVFVITHFFKFTPEQSPLDLAGELALVVLTGIFLVALVIMARHYL